MQKKKQVYFIIGCLLMLSITAGIFYYYKVNQEAYNKIQLAFKETKEFYEVNTPLDAISFIKDTNATSIDYPTIDTSKVGEKTYVYMAYDIEGHSREFVLLLNIVDTIKPIITLSQNEVSVYVDETIDFKSFIKEAYDPVDGNLEVKIDSPGNVKDPGEHETVYTVADKNGNSTSAILKVIVKEKPIPEENNPPYSNEPENGQNKPNNSNGGSDTPNTSPTKPTIQKPSNERFLFADGYDMNSATSTCAGKLANAKKSGYGGGCYPLRDEKGLYIGMELIID